MSAGISQDIVEEAIRGAIEQAFEPAHTRGSAGEWRLGRATAGILDALRDDSTVRDALADLLGERS